MAGGRRFKTEGIYVYLWLIHTVVWKKPHNTAEQLSLQKEFQKIIIVKYRNTQSILHNKDRLSRRKQPVRAEVPYLHWEKEFLLLLSSPDFLSHLKGEKKKHSQLSGFRKIDRNNAARKRMRAKGEKLVHWKNTCKKITQPRYRPMKRLGFDGKMTEYFHSLTIYYHTNRVPG